MILLPSGSQLAPGADPVEVPAGQVDSAFISVVTSPLVVLSSALGEEVLAYSASDFGEVSLVVSASTLLSPKDVFSASVELVIPSVTETFAGSLLVSSAWTTDCENKFRAKTDIVIMPNLVSFFIHFFSLYERDHA